MKENELKQPKLKTKESYCNNISTIKTDWIKRDRIETVIVDVDPTSAQIHTKNLFLYLKIKSPLKQKRELRSFSILRRFSKRYKSKCNLEYGKLDDFDLINKDKMTKDGITPYDWTIFEGYEVKDLGVQNVDNSRLLSNVELSKSILLVFLIDLSSFDTAIHNNKETKENALLNSLKIAKKIVDFHDYRYTENLVLFYNKRSFSEKLKTSDFLQCFENYEGSNTYLDCSFFLRNEITQWFKKGRKRFNVTVIFKESKELCTNNITTIMEFSKDICKRNVFRECDML